MTPGELQGGTRRTGTSDEWAESGQSGSRDCPMERPKWTLAAAVKKRSNALVEDPLADAAGS